MISHRNVIANVLQMSAFESVYRKKLIDPLNQSDHTESVLGLLPLSHIYALVVIAHLSVYRGDGVIILPKFEMKSFLEAIQRFKIQMLFLVCRVVVVVWNRPAKLTSKQVPPIIIMMTKSKSTLDQYDLSSIRGVFTGAAPLGQETADDLQSLFPKWSIIQ